MGRDAGALPDASGGQLAADDPRDAGPHCGAPTPGFGVPGALGLTSLGLFSGGTGWSGWPAGRNCSWWGWLVLLALEVFIIPGFGLPGMLGLAALLGGLGLSVVGAGATWEVILTAMGSVALAVLLALAASLALLRVLPRLPWGRRLVLETELLAGAGGASAPAHDRRLGRAGPQRPRYDRRASRTWMASVWMWCRRENLLRLANPSTSSASMGIVLSCAGRAHPTAGVSHVGERIRQPRRVCSCRGRSIYGRRDDRPEGQPPFSELERILAQGREQWRGFRGGLILGLVALVMGPLRLVQLVHGPAGRDGDRAALWKGGAQRRRACISSGRTGSKPSVWCPPPASSPRNSGSGRWPLSPGQRTQYTGNQNYKAESLMLTGDLNVIDVQWILQYRIEDPVRYLFQVRDTPKTVRDITEAVMRRVVGNRLGSDVLTVGRVAVSSEAKGDPEDLDSL